MFKQPFIAYSASHMLGQVEVDFCSAGRHIDMLPFVSMEGRRCHGRLLTSTQRRVCAKVTHLARKLRRLHHDNGLEDLVSCKDGAILLRIDLLSPAFQCWRFQIWSTSECLDWYLQGCYHLKCHKE